MSVKRTITRDQFWDATVVKELDEGVTNSATLQNDDELFFAIGSGEVWKFELDIVYTTDATGDYKCDLGISTGTAQWTQRNIGENTSNAILSTTTHDATAASTADVAAGGGSTSILRWVNITGYVRGDNAGTINFRFAQNTQTAGQTATTKAGSTLRYRRLA